jgi:hypothetical protein
MEKGYEIYVSKNEQETATLTGNYNVGYTLDKYIRKTFERYLKSSNTQFSQTMVSNVLLMGMLTIVIVKTCITCMFVIFLISWSMKL